MSQSGKFAISLGDRPKPVISLYTEQIDRCLLVYNPESWGGVVLLTGEALAVFKLCNGRNSLEDIRGLVAGNASSEDIFQLVHTLGKAGVLKISEAFSRSIEPVRPKKEVGVWLHVTNSCNFRCSYCYIAKGGGLMSWETAKLAIDKVMAASLKHGIQEVTFKFAGGEPLLSFPLIKRITEYTEGKVAEGLTTRFVVITNGTILDPRIMNFLKVHQVNVSLSLDGVGKYHDAVRKYADGRGSFATIEKNLTLLENSGISPFILAVVSELNLEGLPQLTKYFLERGFSFRLAPVRSTCGSNQSQDFNRSLIETLELCYDILEGSVEKGTTKINHKFENINLRRPRKRACGIGHNAVVVGHTGELALCQMILGKPIGSLLQNDPLEVIRESSEFGLSEVSVASYNVCNRCQWRYVCAGGCPILTYRTYGKIDRPSPFCEVYKAIIPRLIRMEGLRLLTRLQKSRKEGAAWPI